MPFRTSQGISDAEKDTWAINLQGNGSSLLLAPCVTHVRWFSGDQTEMQATVLAVEIHAQ